MNISEKRRTTAAKRKRRVRKKISGTAEKPRLNLFRSSRHVYAQVIDDSAHSTLASVSSFGKDAKVESSNAENCAKLGKILAEACLAKGIKAVCFDKGSSKYHGRVKAFADAAREAGLNF